MYSPLPQTHNRRAAQVALYMLLAATIFVAALAVGIARDGFAADAAAGALGSSDGRTELAQTVAADLTEAEPLVALVPELDRLILAGVESPLLEPVVPVLVENGIAEKLHPLAQPAGVASAVIAITAAAAAFSSFGARRATLLTSLSGLTAAALLLAVPALAQLHGPTSAAVADAAVTTSAVAVMLVISALLGATSLFLKR